MNEQFLVSSVLAGLPVVVRLAAMVFTMPAVASRVVPLRVRLALVAALAILVVPAAAGLPPSPTEARPVALLVTLINEGLIGSLMGLAFGVVLAAAQLAGSLIEGLCGFSMATFGATPDPESGTGPLSRLFWWTTLAVFVAAGGIGKVVGGVLDSFHALPAGSAIFDRSLLDFLVRALAQSFEFGLSAALPAVAALLVASVVLGMAQKSFPQLGGMQVGLSIKATFGMVITSVVLVSAPWMINGGLEVTASQLQELLFQPGSPGRMEAHG